MCATALLCFARSSGESDGGFKGSAATVLDLAVSPPQPNAKAVIPTPIQRLTSIAIAPIALFATYYGRGERHGSPPQDESRKDVAKTKDRLAKATHRSGH